MLGRPTVLKLLVPLACAVIAASCTFDPSSASGAGSGGGRAIDAGDEVRPGADAAATTTPDAAQTPAGPCDLCPGSCSDEGGCVIDCGAGQCIDEVVCPPGIPCTVRCQGNDTCSAGVDCSAASSCSITCTGQSSCSGPLACGPGPCDVGCDANNTCRGGVDCSGSCECEVRCDGSNTCDPAAECPADCSDGDGCRRDGGDCQSTCNGAGDD